MRLRRRETSAQMLIVTAGTSASPMIVGASVAAIVSQGVRWKKADHRQACACK